MRCIFTQELYVQCNKLSTGKKEPQSFCMVLFRQMQYVKCELIILRHDFGAANVEQRRARHPGSNIIVNTIHMKMVCLL